MSYSSSANDRQKASWSHTFIPPWFVSDIEIDNYSVAGIFSKIVYVLTTPILRACCQRSQNLIQAVIFVA